MPVQPNQQSIAHGERRHVRSKTKDDHLHKKMSIVTEPKITKTNKKRVRRLQKRVVQKRTKAPGQARREWT